MSHRNSFLVIVLIVLLVIIGFFVLQNKQSKTTSPTDTVVQEPTTYGIDGWITIDSPVPGDKVASPLVVKGTARGNWYFEASFPIRIYDANNALLGTAIAQAQGDWMTTDFVPFEATLTFSQPTTPTGFIVFEKDNPSGLPENAMEYQMPVIF